jgi:hypothetical protein
MNKSNLTVLVFVAASGTVGINGGFIDGSIIDGISGGGIDGDGCHYVRRGDG